MTQPTGASPPVTQGMGRKEIPQARAAQAAHLEIGKDTRSLCPDSRLPMQLAKLQLGQPCRTKDKVLVPTK